MGFKSPNRELEVEGRGGGEEGTAAASATEVEGGRGVCEETAVRERIGAAHPAGRAAVRRVHRQFQRGVLRHRLQIQGCRCRIPRQSL